MKFSLDLENIQKVDTLKFGPLFEIIQNVGGTIAGQTIIKALKNIDNKSFVQVFVTFFQMMNIFKQGVGLIDMKNVQGIKINIK